MPTFKNIVLKNGADTPVDVTFKTKTNDNRISLWEDRSAGVPIGYPIVRLQTSDSKSVRKVKISIAVPKVESGSTDSTGFSPAPRVAFTHRATQEFFLPMQGSRAERADILAYMRSCLDDPDFVSIILDGDEYTG